MFLKRVFQPEPILSTYIEYYLFLEIQITKDSVGIFCTYPNNSCLMNIFYSEDLPLFIFPDKTLTNYRSFISGYLKQGVRLGNKGNFECVIVQFTPLGSFHLFGIPPSEYFNTFIQTEELLGKDGTEIIEKINLSKSTNETIRHLNYFFFRLLLKRTITISNTEQIVNCIINKNGMVKIDQLVESFGISLKQLERRFISLLGITPKEYSWLTRLNIAYLMLLFRSDLKVCDIMFTLGYYDQSHMIRQFLKYSEITPNDLFVSNTKSLFSRLLLNNPIILKNTI